MNYSNQYHNFTAEDFAKDPFFRSWVLAPDENNTCFWTNWLLQYPHREPVLEDARWQMLQLSVEEEVVAQERLDAIWNTIQTRKATVLEADAHYLELLPTSSAKVIPLIIVKEWRQIAAIFLLVSFCAGTLYLSRPFSQPSQIVSTKFGETKTIILPDHSTVVLNGNSKLSFAKNWSKDEDRKVLLQGEAFFSVTHTQNNQEFWVQLKDGVRVSVLGTKFTITERASKTQVVLNEGKIKLIKEQEKYYGLRTTTLDEAVMQPGDLIEVQTKEPLFIKTTTDQPQLYAAFTQNKIIFKNTLLSEVARVLEDTYGYRIFIAKPGLANKRFSGTTPADDVDMLFAAIEKVFQVQVIKKEKQIIIQ